MTFGMAVLAGLAALGIAGVGALVLGKAAGSALTRWLTGAMLRQMARDPHTENWVGLYPILQKTDPRPFLETLMRTRQAGRAISRPLGWPPTALVLHQGPLRDKLDISLGADNTANFLRSCVQEMEAAVMALGKRSTRDVTREDLVALDPITPTCAAWTWPTSRRGTRGPPPGSGRPVGRSRRNSRRDGGRAGRAPARSPTGRCTERGVTLMTVAEYTVEQLGAWGVEYVFGIPGDTLVPLLDALARQDKVRFIPTRHEGAAALMASAYAKVTGRPAVCAADAGPGAVNLLNGVYDAYADRVPMVVLHGDVKLKHLGTRWPQAQNLGCLFQDVAAFNQTITHPDQITGALPQALRSTEARAQPVRLGLPMDVQTEAVSNPRVVPRRDVPAPDPPPAGTPADASGDLALAAEWLSQARRPVLFVGQGGRQATKQIITLANRLDAAIVHTLPAMGFMPEGEPRNLGVIGEVGTSAAAEAMDQADAVLVIGSTWWQPKFFRSQARVIQIDKQPEHAGMVFSVDLGIVGDAQSVVAQLAERIRERRPERRAAGAAAGGATPGGAPGEAPGGRGWGARLQALQQRRKGELTDGEARGRNLPPSAVMRALADAVRQDAIVCVDTGNNTFWFSRYFPAAGQTILLSGHWRTVGFALPGAIGAQLAAPGRQVVAVTGDGGLGMYLGEFATAVGLELPITVVVLRDGHFAEERTIQEERGARTYGVRFHNPDYVALAEAAGGVGFRVERPDEAPRALVDAVKARRPALVEADVGYVQPNRPAPLEEREAYPAPVQH